MNKADITSLFPGLLGSVAIFLFGMNMLSDGLKKTAGEKRKNIISILINNPLAGILVGTAVTAVVAAVIQSSSATDVIDVGFVSAGLMTLKQATGVITGANNTGTTVTAWLLSTDMGDLVLPLAGIGFILYFFPKLKQLKNIGQIVFSFGFLFVGLNIMSEMMVHLAKSQAVCNTMLKAGGNRFPGLFIGMAFTAVIQSSSAAIAILQKLVMQTTAAGEPLITLRAALTYAIFNVVVSFIFIWLLGPYEYIISGEREKLMKKRNPVTAKVYGELIHTMERMTDNCKNIAESGIDDINHRLAGHYESEGKVLDYNAVN